MDYRRFSVFTVRRHERPEYARYRGKVGDESCWHFDHVTVVVTEVKGERLVYAPVIMAPHFENGGCGKFAHVFLPAFDERQIGAIIDSVARVQATVCHKQDLGYPFFGYSCLVDYPLSVFACAK